MCLLRAKAFEVFIHPGRFAKPQASVLPLFGLACGGNGLLKNVQSQVQRFAACQRQRRPTAAVAVELWLAGWCKSSKINDKRHIPLGQNIDTCHHVQKGNPLFFCPILLSLLKPQPCQLPLLAQPWKIPMIPMVRILLDILGHPGTTFNMELRIPGCARQTCLTHAELLLNVGCARMSLAIPDSWILNGHM